MVSVVKRSARAILLDDQSRLVLIKRTRPGQDPYWTAPGGGLEPADISVQSGLRRELREELGAKAEGYEQVFLFSSPAGEGVSVQHFSCAGWSAWTCGPERGRSSQTPAVAGTTWTSWGWGTKA